MIDDGWEAESGAVVADGDGGVAQVAGGFEADGVEAKCVVSADFSGAFKEEEFAIVGVIGDAAYEVEIKAEAVDGFHAEGGVLAYVVGAFDPLGELVIELAQVADVAQVADEELVSNGAEEAFDFSFGGPVSDRCVDEDGAEPGANEAEFLGGVVGAVIDIDGFGDAAFVEGGLEAVDEVDGVVGRIEGTMGDDAGGIVYEADEEGFERFAMKADLQVRAVECVALPEVVGVGFCKCESGFGTGVGGGFEQFVTVDDAPKGVGCDLGVAEQTFLDAGAVNFGDVVFFPVKGWEDLLNGFEEVLGGDFAGGSFVGPGWWIGDAVFAVVIPPGLDGAPGELAGVAVLVEEDGLTDGLVASEVGVALGVFECPEDSHFEVVADAFHMTLAKLHGGGLWGGLPYRVAASSGFGRQLGHDVKSATVRVGLVWAGL